MNAWDAHTHMHNGQNDEQRKKFSQTFLHLFFLKVKPFKMLMYVNAWQIEGKKRKTKRSHVKNNEKKTVWNWQMQYAMLREI